MLNFISYIITGCGLIFCFFLLRFSYKLRKKAKKVSYVLQIVNLDIAAEPYEPILPLEKAKTKNNKSIALIHSLNDANAVSQIEQKAYELNVCMDAY
ncbi:MAG: hypothetical protein JO072_16430 [Parafilimonas sp.]|nr:hypothetical protein [Parafilimonas sp.]